MHPAAQCHPAAEAPHCTQLAALSLLCSAHCSVRCTHLAALSSAAATAAPPCCPAASLCCLTLLPHSAASPCCLTLLPCPCKLPHLLAQQLTMCCMWIRSFPLRPRRRPVSMGNVLLLCVPRLLGAGGVQEHSARDQVPRCTHSLTHSHTLTITCTCCYGEIKVTQDLKIYSHADPQILSRSLAVAVSVDYWRAAVVCSGNITSTTTTWLLSHNSSKHLPSNSGQFALDLCSWQSLRQFG